MKNKYLQLQHSLNLGTSRTSKSEITAQHDQGPISGMHTMLRGTEKRTTKKPVWLLFLPQILRIYFPCSKKNYEHTPIEARNTSYCVYWLSTAIATLTCLKNPARLLSALPFPVFPCQVAPPSSSARGQKPRSCLFPLSLTSIKSINTSCWF